MLSKLHYWILFSMISFCGLTTTRAQNLNYRHFTIQDGLPSLMVYESFQDRQGFIWFATSAGISRYDGYKFTNYSIEDGLGDNEIFGFFQDSFDRIWLRSLNGKISYFFQGKLYNSKNTPTLKALDKSSMIRKIIETKDRAILITYYNHGLSKYTTNQKAISFPSLNNFYLSASERADGGYTILRQSGIDKLNSEGNLMLSIKIEPGFMKCEPIDDEYYTAYENKLTRINESGNAVVPGVCTKGLIHNINNDGNGEVWLSTAKGAVLYNANLNKQTITYLKNEQVSSVRTDHENNIWFTTLENGIYLLTNQSIKNYTTNDGLSSNKVFSINGDNKDNIWLGHNNYTLTKIDKDGKASLKKLIEHVPEVLKLEIPHINEVIIIESGFFVAATPASVYFHHDSSVTAVSNFNGKSISRWYGDTFVVAGGSNGLRTFSKKFFMKCRQKQIYSARPLVGVTVDDFVSKVLFRFRTNCLYFQEEGKIWVGTDIGLIFLTKEKIINFFEKHPLLQDRILDVKEDHYGTLYVATQSKGIIIVKNNQTIQISKKEGLSSNTCNSIQVDNNIIWVATNGGVNRITLSKHLFPESIFVINTTHGLPSNYINDILISRGKAWIATSEGLSVVDKSIKNVTHTPPVTYVTQIMLNNHMIDTVEHEFDHKENNLKISFVALSYKSQGDIHYKYRLSTTDFSRQELGPWLETKNTSVDLSLLPPGNYTFDVRAQNSSGIWGHPVHYSFAINPPFWRTWWFMLSTANACGFAIFIGWNFSKKIQQKKIADKRNLQLAELKSLRSQTNYHFMSNAFNSLQGLFISENGVDKYIGKFSKLMRFTLENSDRHQILLSEELEYLKIYSDIEQLRVGDRFSFIIEAEEGLKPEQLIVPGLTLQPFIENAIWHGVMPKEGISYIRLKIKPNDVETYKIIIEDDGIGINASLANKAKTNRKSYGTKLIMDRFDIIRQQSDNKFKIAIEDLADLTQTHGTRVTLILPYQYDK